MTPDYKTYADELDRVTSEGAAECTADRQHYAAYLFGVVALAASELRDVCRELFGKAKAKAHKAKVLDDEARSELAKLREGLKDGRVDKADLVALEKAERLVARSAELDHDLSEGDV